jgi:5-formyltetrahydrofolate cyclo-ligase
MSEPTCNKSVIRRELKETLAAMTPALRHQKSLAACAFIGVSPEFAAARVIMLFLSTPHEVETASLALRAWQRENRSSCRR